MKSPQTPRVPKDVIGLHFFSPANVMRLLEVVRGAKTAPDVIATANAQSQRRSKSALSRLAFVMALLAIACWSPISAKGRACFWRVRRQNRWMTPLRVSAWPWAFMRWQIWPGLMWAPACVKNGAVKSLMIQPTRLLQDKLFELGRLGQKTGRGSYLYRGTRTV